ncbi:hypothetical protein ACFSQJ_19515 [Croceitalea marina]|uniref:Prenyltransferase n=1 Tax=Croceitalea marina TaxID=1775166 RepID=A0ABW5N224_9FLAO
MRFLRQAFDFYLDASIHVALAVVTLYFSTLQIIETSTNWQLASFLFFGTIVCYNFIKYGVEAEKYLIVSNPYHKLIQGFSFLAFAFSAYFFLQLGYNLWFAIMTLLGVSVLYAIPLLPKAKNLRSLAGLKTFLVALVWMGCTVVLPLVDNDIKVTWDIGILLLQRFLLVLILLLPFEIRDLKFDKPELKTMPQRIGVEKTKTVGYVLTVFYAVLLFFKDSISIKIIVIDLLLSLVLLVVLKKTTKEQTNYFSSFWVEGIPLLYLGILVFTEKLF